MTSRIFLSEMHNVIAHVQKNTALLEQGGTTTNSSTNNTQRFSTYDSEILCDEIYHNELHIILPIAVLYCKDFLPIEVSHKPLVVPYMTLCLTLFFFVDVVAVVGGHVRTPLH